MGSCSRDLIQQALLKIYINILYMKSYLCSGILNPNSSNIQICLLKVDKYSRHYVYIYYMYNYMHIICVLYAYIMCYSTKYWKQTIITELSHILN